MERSIPAQTRIIYIYSKMSIKLGRISLGENDVAKLEEVIEESREQPEDYFALIWEKRFRRRFEGRGDDLAPTGECGFTNLLTA